MEEFLNLKDKKKTELTVQKQQQVERELIGHIVPHSGHRIYEINIKTLDIQEADFLKWETLHLADLLNLKNKGKTPNLEILTREGYAYVSALNKANALKKYKKGLNGSKAVSNPLPIKLF
jgi:hypothetical protein